MVQLQDRRTGQPVAEKCVPGKMLVTGANGFIGARVVENLMEKGYRNVRCLVRGASQQERLLASLSQWEGGECVEVAVGDLLSPSACEEAARGVSIIYHLAAGFEKSFAGAFMNSAVATRNLMDAFLQVGVPQRFVNVSSFAVYSCGRLRRGGVLDERCPLEDAPQERADPYGFGKLKQEELVREYGEQKGLPFVILRPGTVFGPGKTELSARIGIRTFGPFVQIGGSHLIPLSYVDNCAEAIVLAGVKEGVAGETINVVDDELLTGKQFLDACRRGINGFSFVRIPYWAGYLFSRMWEDYSIASQGQLPAVFNRRRCWAEWKPKRFCNRKLRERLGWRPRVGLDEAMKRFVGQFAANHE